MPPAIGAALAALGAFVGGVAIGKALLVGVVTLAGNLVLGALAKPRKARSARIRMAETTISVKQPAEPWHIVFGSVRKGGVVIYMEMTGTNNEFLNIVYVLAAHKCQAVDTLYFGEEVVPLDGSGDATGKYATYVHAEYALGDAAQAAIAGLVTESAGLWTANHRCRGHCIAWVRLKWNKDKFPNGLPNISFDIRGVNEVFDPRDTLTKYTNNSALCLGHYLAHTKWGLSETYGVSISNPDLIAAANVCDEDVVLTDLSTEDRYTCNGWFSLDMAPAEIVRSINSSMGGNAVWHAGTWSILPAAWRAPTVTLTQDDLRGSVAIQNLQSRRTAVNRVKGLYTSLERNWQLTDFPPITNATYLTEDGNVELWGDIILPLTTSPATAQRLAKIHLESNRQEILVELPCKLSAWQLRPGDTVSLTFSRYGWSAKAFEVTDVRLALDESGGAPALGVDLGLKETAAAVYDWADGEETVVDPAPNSTLPDPFAVAVPTNLVLESGTASLFIKGDGTIISRIRATWTLAVDAFVDHYEVQYKKTADSTWLDVANVGNTPEVFIFDVQDGVSYDVRVRAINAWNVTSAWVTATGHVVVGKTQPPGTVANFYAQTNEDGLALLFWDALPDLDLAHYEIRYAALEGGLEAVEPPFVFF